LPSIASLTISVNIPPKYGVINVVPMIGNAIFTDFLISVNGATDPNTPLTFKVNNYFQSY
jgi:hypothetical protein